MILPEIKVYRVENTDGEGPFQSDQRFLKFFKYHDEPLDLIVKSGITKKTLQDMHKRGYLYGWVSEETYINFFILKAKVFGEKQIYINGFKKMEYTVTDYHIFSDGQIIFHPESIKKDVTPEIRKMKNSYKKMKHNDSNTKCFPT